MPLQKEALIQELNGFPIGLLETFDGLDNRFGFNPLGIGPTWYFASSSVIFPHLTWLWNHDDRILSRLQTSSFVEPNLIMGIVFAFLDLA